MPPSSSSTFRTCTALRRAVSIAARAACRRTSGSQTRARLTGLAVFGFDVGLKCLCRILTALPHSKESRPAVALATPGQQLSTRTGPGSEIPRCHSTFHVALSPDLCTRAAPRGHPERTERTGDPGIRRESDGLELFLVLHPKAIAVTPRVCGKEEPRTQRPAKRSSRT